MKLTAQELYERLPAIYRIRDGEKGPLKALVQVLAGQAMVMEEDIAGLYENWFIETCEDWVVPYIGDLLGVRGLHPVDAAISSQRAYVANTLRYRRRKGTATMLEQLAHDITGWNARAVEFFQILGWTQNYNHVRPQNFRTPDLRRTNELELIDTAFDEAAHTVDVRHINNGRGRHNIPNVGIFLWRLQSYFLPRSQARPTQAVGDGRFSFHALAIDVADATIFNRPETEEEITHLAEEINVPGRLRRRPLYDELEERRQAIVDLRASWELSTESLAQLRADGVLAAVVQKLEPLVDLGFRDEPALVLALNAHLSAAEVTDFRSAILGRALQISDAIYFDEQPVFEIFVQANPGAPFLRVPPEEIMICYLSEPRQPLPPTPPVATPEVWLRPPATKNYNPISGALPQARNIAVGVDTTLGRIAFPLNVVPNAVKVSCAYGFSGDLGGGAYDRRESLAGVLPPRPSDLTWQAGVSKEIPAVPSEIFPTIGDALDAWDLQGPGNNGLIVVMDNSTYEEDLLIKVPEGSSLVVAAASWPQVHDTTGPHRVRGQFDAFELRPHLLGKIQINTNASPLGPLPGKLSFNGLLIEGSVTVTAAGVANLGELRLDHCTVVPGFGGLKVNGSNADLKVRLARSICGEIDLPVTVTDLYLDDSIVDGDITAPSAELSIEKCTVFGKTTAKRLQAGNSIFEDVVKIEQKQDGCVRFCSLAEGSITPRRFSCQPDLALKEVLVSEQAAIRARLRPSFTSTRHGHPAYAQLSLTCAAEILTGAEDGAEMGAFNFLKQAHREINLRSSLNEYLRFGLEAGLIFVT
jgi:hypothetical protein